LTAAILIWLLAILLIALGLAGLVLPVLPGPLLLFAGLVAAAWAENFSYVGLGTLSALGIMALLSILIDFIAGALGARKYGASGRAVIGATVGAALGIFLGLPGVVLGPFIGAVIGELSVGRKLHAVSRAGVGATLGLLLGVAAKLALGLAMLGVFAVMRFV
jgi:uncharacterized protein YqgC (DUF456 family)